MAHLETPTGTQDIHNREKESIQTLLPVQLRENSAVFIAFLEDYYEYVNQQNQATNLIDRISSEHDIDFTSDLFLNEIKKEIAKGIPESTVLNNRQLFKKIVDYYYTRGSQNSADVFFKLFYDDEVTITYPKETLFKTSDATLNNHGFIDIDGANVQWSNITGDFVKQRTEIPTGGKKGVFIASSDGANDHLRGTYIYNSSNKRWEKTGEVEQFFIFNSIESRWEFVRQKLNYRWGYDSAEIDVRATDEEGFWSIIGGQTNRWNIVNGGSTHSHQGYTVNGSIPTASDIQVNGTTASDGATLDNATTRGNTVIQDVVLEDKKHENEFFVHYGELEGDFWQVENESILNSDGQSDNIGEHIEMNVRHIYAEENFIKYPLSSHAFNELTYNDSVTKIDDYSIIVDQTSLDGSASGRSNNVTIPLGKCGNHGDLFRLTGTVAILESSGSSRGSLTQIQDVFLSSASKGWSDKWKTYYLLTEDENIIIPNVTGSEGKRGFNVVDGSGMAGEFEVILERDTKEDTGGEEAELTFSSEHGADFRISGLRLEKCKDAFLRLGVNTFSTFKVGDVIASHPDGTTGNIETGQIISLTDQGTNQKFIDYAPTVVTARTSEAINASATIKVDENVGGIIQVGMEVYWDGMPQFVVRTSTVVKAVTSQNEITLGRPTSDYAVTIPDNTQIKFISKPIPVSHVIRDVASLNGGVTKNSTAISRDIAFQTTSGVIYHKDYNRNKQMNSMWYTGNRDRSESTLRAMVYESPGVDPESNTFYGRVVAGTSNSNKVNIVDYENIPRIGQRFSYGYKPGGIWNANSYRYSPGAPTQIMSQGGQSYSSAAIVTALPTNGTGTVTNFTLTQSRDSSNKLVGRTGNMVIRKGMLVTSASLDASAGVTVASVTDQFNITLSQAISYTSGETLNFLDPSFTEIITNVSFQRTAYAKVSSATNPTGTSNTFELTLPIVTTTQGSELPSVGDLVGGKFIKKGSTITAVSSVGTTGSGSSLRKTANITLTDQAHTVCKVISVVSGTSNKTFIVEWVKGQRPSTSNWGPKVNVYMRKSPSGSLWRRNYNIGGIGTHSMNGSSFPKVTSISKVADNYKRYQVTFDVAQPNLTDFNYDEITFAASGEQPSGSSGYLSRRNIGNNTPLKFTKCEITLRNKVTIYADGGWANFHYRGIRSGGHYYASDFDLPFFDNRSNGAGQISDEIVASTTELIELGTHEGNTTIYAKDKDGNTSIIAAPKSFPYREVKPGIPSGTVVFSDKGFVVAPKGIDAFVLPLNMYGKQFASTNLSADNEWFYGYALENCIVKHYSLEQHREGVRLGDEHRFAEVLRKLGPRAEETDVMLTPHSWDSTFNYGRDAQTYYEVKVAGDYSSYIEDSVESIILRNNRTISYSESKHLQVGDIFTPKATSQGSVLLKDGLKVKAGPTEIKHVKAGEKFTFTGNRHVANKDSGFTELNILSGSHGRHYLNVFESDGNIVLAQSYEELNEEGTVLSPLSDKTLGFRQDNHSIGPLALSGKESWYFSDHGRLGYNGIPIEGARVIHDYQPTAVDYTIDRPYLVTLGAVSNSTTYRYDSTTLMFEDHAESLVPGVYCEIALAQSALAQTGTQLLLDGLKGTITAGLEVQIRTGDFTSSSNAGTTVTVVSVDSQTPGTGNSYNGSATVTVSETITGLGNNKYVGFYAKVATTPTRMSRGTKIINSRTNFFDRNVTLYDNQTVFIGPHLGGDVTNLNCSNQNCLNNISLLAVGSKEPYLMEGTTVTVGSATRKILRVEDNRRGHLDGTISAMHGSTIAAADVVFPTWPSVVLVELPLSHEIYTGVTQKIGKVKNLGYSNYDVNDEDALLIGKDRNEIIVPAFAKAKVNGATSSSNSVILDDHVLAQDPTGTFFDSGMSQYSSPYNEEGKKYPPFHYMYSKIKVGMEVSGTGVTAGTTVTAVTDQYNITLSNSLSLTDNVELTFRAPTNITFSAGMEVSGTGIVSGTKISSVTSQGTLAATIVLDTSATLSDNTILTFTLNNSTITALVNGTTFNNVKSVIVDNVKYGNIDVATITTTTETAPAHIEFVGIGHTVDKGDHTGHYDESIGDPLFHYHRQDGTGNDTFMSLPVEKLKDTYIVPHAIKDWVATTIYNNRWKVYFWDSDGVSPARGWVQFADINRPFARQGVTQIQSFPTGETFGSSTNKDGSTRQFQTDPNNSSFTPTLWKFEADRPFFLAVNDTEGDEEAVFGFNRNTYSNTPYSFYADYADRRGRLSDVNKIHDGEFNQEFSYGLNTTLSLDKWETQYRKLVHPSGTKFFGLLNLEGEVNKTEIARRNAHLSSGNPTYRLSEGIEWLKNLRLDVGQHSPRFQPGWLDEALTALVEIEPLVNAGVSLPSSITDIIDQILEATYRFTHTKTNGISTLNLRTTHVSTTTPVSIDSLNLTSFPRPNVIDSRDIENSGLNSNAGGLKYQIDKVLNSARNPQKPFQIKNLLNNAGGPSQRDLLFEESGSDHIIKIKLLNGTFTTDRQYHLRMYGLQSGAKYRITGEVRVSENTLSGSGLEFVQVGVDISDGYVQENEVAQNNGTYTPPNNTTGPGNANIRVNAGATSSFTSFSVTGTYWNTSDRPTIGRNNVVNTHDFIDINLRVHHTNGAGNYTGAVTAEYKNLKIEEFYTDEQTIFTNSFDTRNIASAKANVGEVKTDTFTNFTSWHNPINPLKDQTFFSYQPFDIPYNVNLRAKLASGGKPTPIIGDTTPFEGSRFEVSENITRGSITTSISKVTDISNLKIYKDGVTISGFTGANSFLNGIYSRDSITTPSISTYSQVSPANGGVIEREDISAGTEDDSSIVNYNWGIIDGNTTTSPTITSNSVDRSDSSPGILQPWQMTWSGISVVYNANGLDDATTRLTVGSTTNFNVGDTIVGGTSQATATINKVADSTTLEIKETLGVRTVDFTFN
jgi:hypothetical protein